MTYKVSLSDGKATVNVYDEDLDEIGEIPLTSEVIQSQWYTLSIDR